MHSPQFNDVQVNRKLLNEPKRHSVLSATNNNLISLNNNGNSKQTQALLKQYQQVQFGQNGELNLLDSPEVTLNIHNLIEELQFSGEGLLDSYHDLASKYSAGQYSNTNVTKPLAYMPQPVHSSAAYSPPQNSGNSDSDSSFSSDVTSIKEEPQDLEYFNGTSDSRLALPNICGGFGPLGNVTHNHGNMKKKFCDKGSDEYRKKRLRNNIAVRKSREKANQRKREIEQKNKMLLNENEKLNKQLDLLTDELNMLKSLVASLGVSPAQLSREFSKHIDAFQLQQHANL